MYIDTWEEGKRKESSIDHGRGLMMTCPICGREFGCNKTYHVYTALAARRRLYYCSYSCYKQRPNPKARG